MARLEAVLFLAKEPLHVRKLGRLANLADGTEARTLLTRLNQKYREEGRAFRVEELGGGWQLRTLACFAPWLRRLGHLPQETRLSQPALETLAVIAYRQPVLRSEIEAIRGVNCGEVIRQLMERDFVRVTGRSQELGRPFLYGTTRNFLTVFGMRDLSDLPRADLFRTLYQGGAETANSNDSRPGQGEKAVTVTTAKRSGFTTIPTTPEGELLEPWQRVTPTNVPLAKKDEEEEEDDDDEDWEDDDDEDDDDADEDEDWDDDEDEDWDDEDEDEDDEEDEELEALEDEEGDEEDLEEDEEWDEESDEDEEDWEEVDDEFEEDEEDEEDWDDDDEDEDEDDEDWEEEDED